MYVLERISQKFAAKIGTSLELDDQRIEVLAYGAFNLLHALWSTFLVVLFGLIFKCLAEILIISTTAAVLRKYSGGAHATTPSRCAAIGVIVFGMLSLAIKIPILYSSPVAVAVCQIAVFSFAFYIMYKHCPVDSPNKPIKSEKKRRRFRRISFCLLGILVTAVTVLWGVYVYIRSVYILRIALCLAAGTAWQSFTLTFPGHIVMKNIDAILGKVRLNKEV